MTTRIDPSDVEARECRWRAAADAAAVEEAGCTLLLPGADPRRPVPMYFRRVSFGVVEFTMGQRGKSVTEEPVHRVRLIHESSGGPFGFYLATFPVTLEQWSAGRDEFLFRRAPVERIPVTRISWEESMQYCDRLGRVAIGIPRGFSPCLPSEAEWEFACRSGSTTEYFNGDGEAALRESGWFEGQAPARGGALGCFGPNSFGLHDMHGSVREWCYDVYDKDAYRDRSSRTVNPVQLLAPGASHRASFRVLRGGSSTFPAEACRSASRLWGQPRDRFIGFGFRVCLLPNEVVSKRTGRAQADRSGRA